MNRKEKTLPSCCGEVYAKNLDVSQASAYMKNS